MVEQPSGTVTLVFTDIEGSTRLLHDLGEEAYREALAEHRRVVRSACGRHGGYEVDYEGDSFFYAFQSAGEAVTAIEQAMRELEGGPIDIRVGIHTGEPGLDPPKYVGVDVHKAARIMAAGHGGQVVVSQSVRDLLDGSLVLTDLGEHRLKDLPDSVRLYQLGEGDFPSLRTLYRTNLPVPATSFVGRERELAEVESLLTGSGSRLVTLTGPGGTGKTRLALEAAGALVDEFADGAFVVFLAAVREPNGVLSAVAQTLGLREQPGQTLEEAVTSFLHERRLLLVLDNFEHLVRASPLLSEWLAAAVGLRLLVTSRASLRVSGEQVYDVHPLSLGGAVEGEAAGFGESEAVLLFVARARAARPEFALTDDNSAAVAEICVRLDGLPLALELAAARVRVLSPQALLPRLERRLALLTGGGRDLEERQRTMAATIAWSYDLLSQDQQQLFARLGVFVGGFRFDAAEAIIENRDATPLDLLDGLSSLVEESLLVEQDESDGEPRFFMLETIREYACERLEELGEAAALRRAHAVHFLALAEDAGEYREGKEHGRWIARLAADHANLDAALAALSQIDPEAELRLAAALGGYWRSRGLWLEGRQRLALVLARGGRSPSRVRALLADGEIAIEQGRFEEALSRVDEAATLLEPGDTLTRAQLLRLRAWVSYFRDETTEQAEAAANKALELLEGRVAVRSTINLELLLSSIWAERGDLDRAHARLEQTLATAREHGDRPSLAEALRDLGNVELQLGHIDRARVLLNECLELNSAMEDRNPLAHTLTLLSMLERAAGNIADARAFADEAVTGRRSVGARHGLAMSLGQRAAAAFADGDITRSREDAQGALRICEELGDRQGIAWTIEQLAAIAAAEDDPCAAARLVGAAHAIREKIAWPPTKLDGATIANTLKEARAKLGKETVTSLEAEGAAMPLQQAIETALQARASTKPQP